ncbi:DUF4396 domain-containing protein [Streptomyces sp. NPDC059176]|uniref:DUF4396 domain-containing protein n=1 Tax=unclassified Streptomyces TaxID=2593676 RepID=UPI0036995A7C
MHRADREVTMLLDGVMLLWFIQVVIAVAFVAIDIRTTPEATVMKWGFVIVTAFSGLFGALLYTLSCREPLPGTHEQYVAAKWRQVVGSTMHCVAGDGIGILVAAVVTTGLGLPMWADVLCEYAFGFLFGWTVFQALFMKDMFGSYRRSLSKTFISEFLSMNAVMGGMTAVMVPWMTHDTAAMSPDGARFWFVMSIALCAGFVVALPMNWWLVDHGLKHGMMTVRHDNTPLPQAAALAAAGAALTDGPYRPAGSVLPSGHAAHRVTAATTPAATGEPGASTTGREHHAMESRVNKNQLAVMTVVSLTLFGLGFLVAGLLGDLTMHR